jgi:4-diphosphocytidyl-2-C-methyl-D-erythritol kinase
VQIHLHKIIPTGAGLGGGSSDGAFTLTLLDRLFALNLTSEQLCNYAAELGSDCPFFIENKPAFGTQKGNVLNNITLDLGGYYFVLVKPSISIGTSGAYRGVKPRKPEESVDTLVNLPINQWKYKVFNDFENSIFPDYPIIKEIKDGLYEAGALYACMTGSGSAVYGIFEGEVDFSTNKKQEFCWAGYL